MPSPSPFPRHRLGRTTLPLLLALPFTPARAADLSWSAPASGRWLDPANWSTGTIPTPADSATVSTPGSYTVTLDDSAAIGPLTLDNPDATLLLDNPDADLTFSTSDVTITAGSLSLRQHASYHLRHAIDPYHPTVNVAPDGRIDFYLNPNRAGLFLANVDGNVVNAGTIQTHETDYGMPSYRAGAYFGESSHTFTNTGSILTSPRTRIQIEHNSFYQNAGTIAGNLTFTGGYAFYYNGGSVNLVTLNSSGTLYIAPSAHDGTFASGGLYDGLTIPNLPAGNTFYITPGTTVTWSYSFPSPTNDGHLLISHPPPNVPNAFGTATLVFPYHHPLTNNGLLEIDSDNSWPTPLDFDLVNHGDVIYHRSYNPVGVQHPAPTGNWTNTGNITVEPGANVQFDGETFTQTAGTLTTNDAVSFVYHASLVYTGGTIAGAVTLKDSSLTLGPAAAPASFTFTGTTGALHGDTPSGSSLTLAGPDPNLAASPLVVTADSFTNAGSITIAGAATLKTTSPFANPGTIDLASPASLLLLNYTTPTPADAVRQQLVTGHLTSSAADPAHRLGYLDSGAALSVRLTLAGDANLDGVLNADDYVLLDRGYATGGAFWWQGDFNYDGLIDQQDYLLIDSTLGLVQQGFSPGFLSARESQFGPAYVSSLLASVPEPATPFLLLPALTFLHRRRARRSQSRVMVAGPPSCAAYLATPNHRSPTRVAGGDAPYIALAGPGMPA
jgi:hypothetical protein